MFDDLMGNLEKHQTAIQKKLGSIILSVKQEGITITGNATKTIDNIQIDQALIDSGDKEMIEDVLVSAFNRFIEDAQKAEASETQNMMQDILPPGFGDLFK